MNLKASPGKNPVEESYVFYTLVSSIVNGHVAIKGYFQFEGLCLKVHSCDEGLNSVLM